MEKRKKKWETVNKFSIAILFISAVGLILSVAFATKDVRGFFGALLAVSLQYLIISAVMLRSEKILKKDYLMTNDERNIQIKKNASQSAFNTVSMLISIAAIVCCFIDKKIFYTLTAFIIFVQAVYFAFVLYYRNKL